MCCNGLSFWWGGFHGKLGIHVCFEQVRYATSIMEGIHTQQWSYRKVLKYKELEELFWYILDLFLSLSTNFFNHNLFLHS
jgi:hypothetical protein